MDSPLRRGDSFSHSLMAMGGEHKVRPYEGGIRLFVFPFVDGHFGAKQRGESWTRPYVDSPLRRGYGG